MSKLIIGFFLVAALIIAMVVARNIFDKVGNIKDVEEASKKADKVSFIAEFFMAIVASALFISAFIEMKSEDVSSIGVIGMLVASSGIIFQAIEGIRKIFEDNKDDEKLSKKKKKNK